MYIALYWAYISEIVQQLGRILLFAGKLEKNYFPVYFFQSLLSAVSYGVTIIHFNLFKPFWNSVKFMIVFVYGKNDDNN